MTELRFDSIVVLLAEVEPAIELKSAFFIFKAGLHPGHVGRIAIGRAPVVRVDQGDIGVILQILVQWAMVIV